MGHRARLVFQNTGWSAASQLVFVAAKFISVPLILNHYGKEEYGIIVVITALSGIFRILSAGLPVGIVRFASGWIAASEWDELKRGVRTSLSVFCLFGIANALLLGAIGLYGHNAFGIPAAYLDDFKMMIFISAIASAIMWYFSVADQMLAAFEDVAWVSRCMVIPALLEVTWVLIARHQDYPFAVFYAGQLVATLTPIPLKLGRLSRYIKPSGYFRPGWFWHESKAMFRFSAGLFTVSLSQNAVNKLRPIILGMRSGNGIAAAAEYRVLSQVAELVMLMKSWFSDPLLPTMVKAVARNDHAFVERTAYKLTRVAWVVTVFPIVMIAVCSRDILQVYVGDQSQTLYVWLSFWMLAFIGSYLSPVSSIVLAKGYIRPLVYFTSSTALFSLVIYWVFAPRLNVGATVVGNVFFSIAHIFFIMSTC